MSVVYASAVDKFLRAQINITTATVKAQLVGAYVYSSAHAVLADLTNTIAAPATVAVTSVSAGKVYVGAATFPAPTTGQRALAVVLYVDDGATRPLLAYDDRRADLVPFDITTDGADLILTWPDEAFSL